MFYPRKEKRNARNVAAAEKVDLLVVEMQERKKNPVVEVTQADPVVVAAKGRKKRKKLRRKKKKAENVNAEVIAAVMKVALMRAELTAVMREETMAVTMVVIILAAVTPGKAKAENRAIKSLERRRGPPLR